MKNNNIKEELFNRELLPFSHIYWKRKDIYNTDFANISKSRRHNTTKNLVRIFYKNIVRLK